MLTITIGYFVALVAHLDGHRISAAIGPIIHMSGSDIPVLSIAQLLCIVAALLSLALAATFGFGTLFVTGFFLSPGGGQVLNVLERFRRRYPNGSRNEGLDVICNRWLLKK